MPDDFNNVQQDIRQILIEQGKVAEQLKVLSSSIVIYQTERLELDRRITKLEGGYRIMAALGGAGLTALVTLLLKIFTPILGG